jgi:hypothetical protein
VKVSTLKTNVRHEGIVQLESGARAHNLYELTCEPQFGVVKMN